jgi:hypothetical protein
VQAVDNSWTSAGLTPQARNNAEVRHGTKAVAQLPFKGSVVCMCMCVCMCEGEREKEREREKENERKKD